MPDNEHEKNKRQAERQTAIHPVKVWDGPTRLFHWALVVFTIISYVTAMMGGLAMEYHEWSGVAILVLVLFRILWGAFGGEQSRFKAFVRGPSALLRYAQTIGRRDYRRHLGHNPLGGWSVLLMLAALLVQAGTGLFANDDILTEGPLAYRVSSALSGQLTSVHHLNKVVLAALIALHVTAILFYLIVKRDNLITPMITGRKAWHREIQPARGNPWLAAGLVLGLVMAVYFWIY